MPTVGHWRGLPWFSRQQEDARPDLSSGRYLSIPSSPCPSVLSTGQFSFLVEEVSSMSSTPEFGPPVRYDVRSDRTKPKGLGTFRLGPKFELEGRGELANWIYVAPDGRENDTNAYWPGPPPPLPQPSPRSCDCRYKSGTNGWEIDLSGKRHSHTCGACGQPHWIEIHGMADGFCTYCYHRG